MSFEPHLAFLAAAGSGKTFALTARYLSLLFMGESPATILAATFTNKAAAEMHERVVEALQNLEQKEELLEVIIAQTGLSKAELLKRAPQVRARFFSMPNHIVTLDSFVASILKSASLELGIEPDFELRANQKEPVKERFFRLLDKKDLLHTLAKLSLDIEDKRGEKLFEVFGTLYQNDALLPKLQLKRASLEAQEEQIDKERERLLQLVIDSGASKSAIANFMPCSVKELFKKGVFGYKSLLEHRFYKKYVAKYPEIDRHFLRLKALLKRWAKTKESIILDAFFKLYGAYKEAIVEVAQHKGVLDFDDLGYFAYVLLYHHISKEFLYFKLDAKFKHILIDEFQDTSILQFLLLKPLIDEIFSGQGQNEFRSFFYVGDTKQSLYRFRGGVEELFMHVAKHYGVKVEMMDTNYRSAQTIVEQTNRWFEGKMEDFVPQKPKKDVRLGYVEVVQATNEQLIDVAVQKAKALIELGAKPDEIAFLTATNNDGKRLHERCLSEGIPALLKTSTRLKNDPLIASLVAMLEHIYLGEKIDALALLEFSGKELDEVDLSWFDPLIEPSEAIHHLINAFGLDGSDGNMLRLLSFASKYADIAAFLDAFAWLDASVAEGSMHGAKIMTVHGSKGLEFRYVILLDRIGKPRPDGNVLLFEQEDDLSISRIFYKMENRDAFDEAYANALERGKLFGQKDHLNRLYVATTRAKEALFVLQKEQKSDFEPLGLTPMQAGVLQIGKEWPDTDKQEAQSVPTLHYYGRQEHGKREMTQTHDYKSVLFGTALHYGLEMLDSFDAVSAQKALQAVRNRYGALLKAQQLQDIGKRIERLCFDERFLSLIEGGKVHKEQPIVYEGGIKKIDLWVEHATHNIIIDYKSAKSGEAQYREQVACYMEAMERITGKPAKGAIVYLLKNEIFVENLNIT